MTVNTTYFLIHFALLHCHPILLSITTYTSPDALLILIYTSWALFSFPDFNISVHWLPHLANILMENFRTLHAKLFFGRFAWVLFCHSPSPVSFGHKSHFQLGLGKIVPRITWALLDPDWVCSLTLLNLMANVPPALTKEVHLPFTSFSLYAHFYHETVFPTTDTQLQHHCHFPECKLSKC